MRSLLWLSLLPVPLLARPLVAQTDSARAGDVLAAEDRRFAAMLRADTATLGRLLAPDLRYTHSSGRLDTKQALLQSLGAGTLRYAVIAPEERSVRFYGNTAVEVGRSTMRAGAPDRLQAFRIQYLAIYGYEGGSWLLIAWQSTRLPK